MGRKAFAVARRRSVRIQRHQRRVLRHRSAKDGAVVDAGYFDGDVAEVRLAAELYLVSEEYSLAVPLREEIERLGRIIGERPVGVEGQIAKRRTIQQREIGSDGRNIVQRYTIRENRILVDGKTVVRRKQRHGGAQNRNARSRSRRNAVGAVNAVADRQQLIVAGRIALKLRRIDRQNAGFRIDCERDIRALVGRHHNARHVQIVPFRVDKAVKQLNLHHPVIRLERPAADGDVGDVDVKRPVAFRARIENARGIVADKSDPRPVGGDRRLQAARLVQEVRRD